MLRIFVSTRALFATIFILHFASLLGFSQTLTITGKVVNKHNNTPLSFVNVLVNDNLQGTTTNIDGLFAITIQENQLKKLSFSYVGYETFAYQVKNRSDLKPLRRKLSIKLYKKAVPTPDASVFDGENPANQIIQQVYKNRKRNNPENLKSYRYNAYHKFYLNLKKVIPSQIDSSEVLDSTEKRLAHYLQKHHLFLSEAVTAHQYIFPNYYKKTLKGNRLSGVRNPDFLKIDDKIQPFSFYKEHIQVFGKKYLNPISRESHKKYSFDINDTLLIGENNIYVISFKPLPNKNFEGLKGILYINTKHFAIQNVVFEPVDDFQSNSFRIQQEYRLLEDKFWFPVQLSADIIFRNKRLGKRPMVGTMRTFLQDIELFPPLRRKDFNKITFEIDPIAHKQAPAFWQKYHQDHPLSSQDTSTYVYVDSVNNHTINNNLLKVMELATYNSLTYKFLDFKVSEFLKYNQYEGVRLGAHFSTNEEISHIFKGTGYLAYGFKDGNLKYGLSIGIHNLFKRFDPQLGAYFSNDVAEPGSLNLLQPDRWLSNHTIRSFLTARMDRVQRLGGYVKARPFRNLQVSLNFENRQINPAYAYDYQGPSLEDVTNFTLKNRFNTTEISVGVRYAYREAYMKKGRHQVYLGSQLPIVQFNYKRGLPNILNSEYDYYKIEGQATYSFTIPQTGTTTIQLQGGMAQGNIPYPLLYNGRGGLTHAPIMINNNFQVMGLYEFISDRFFNTFISQNLGRLLYQSKSYWFQPELVLVHNMGFGSLNNPERHQNIDFKTLEKGYFESGILLNNLLKVTYFQVANLNIGAGIFYRYGAYTKKGLENFAVKMSLGLSF